MSAAAEVRVRASNIDLTFTVCQALCSVLSSRAGVGRARTGDLKSFLCHPSDWSWSSGGLVGCTAQDLESAPPAAVSRVSVLKAAHMAARNTEQE